MANIRTIETIFPMKENIVQRNTEGKGISWTIDMGTIAFTSVTNVSGKMYIEGDSDFVPIDLNGTFDNQGNDSLVTVNLTKAQVSVLTPRTYKYDVTVTFETGDPRSFAVGDWEIKEAKS